MIALAVYIIVVSLTATATGLWWTDRQVRR